MRLIDYVKGPHPENKLSTEFKLKGLLAQMIIFIVLNGYDSVKIEVNNRMTTFAGSEFNC